MSDVSKVSMAGNLRRLKASIPILKATPDVFYAIHHLVHLSNFLKDVITIVGGDVLLIH